MKIAARISASNAATGFQPAGNHVGEFAQQRIEQDRQHHDIQLHEFARLHRPVNHAVSRLQNILCWRDERLVSKDRAANLWERSLPVAKTGPTNTQNSAQLKPQHVMRQKEHTGAKRS
ncbi:hypothetical protein [Rhodobacter sp. 24-YEA-8]|uniref:hypothetical protein n=1 Tax=Rhodobacter sp. 24-YEA-8 TaxID=1884310 RepID=UPI00149620F6|nr:hypothetical protein [Rhodobacter sp. 24-YEA-8]